MYPYILPHSRNTNPTPSLALRVQVATRRAEEIESQDRLESNISNAVSAPAFASGSAISGASNVSSASSFTSIDSVSS